MQPGTILFDKYRTERVIGQGGMGTVILARHLQLDQLVAIKILRPQAVSNPEFAQRFLHEAQAAARLKSEHVCRVYDVGKLHDGTPYMVIEYLDGVDLATLLRDRSRLDPGVTIDLLLQACEAIAEAHALGMVHRDIKPSNFFLTRGVGGSTLVKVLDFGISKMAAGQNVALTGSQAIMGTPAYMSPEQMRSSKLVDARTDIWALGIVLYELLAGRLPFDADSFSGICLQVTAEPLPPLSVPLPRGLSDVVARCLEKAPAQRFQTVAELAEALAPYAASAGEAQRLVERIQRALGGPELRPRASPRNGHRIDATGTVTGNRSAGEIAIPTPGAGRHGKLAWFVLVGTALAIITLAGTLLLRGGDGDSESAQSPPAASEQAPRAVEPSGAEETAAARPEPAARAPAVPQVDAGTPASDIEERKDPPAARKPERGGRRRRPPPPPLDPIRGTRL